VSTRRSEAMLAQSQGEFLLPAAPMYDHLYTRLTLQRLAVSSPTPDEVVAAWMIYSIGELSRNDLRFFAGRVIQIDSLISEGVLRRSKRAGRKESAMYRLTGTSPPEAVLQGRIPSPRPPTRSEAISAVRWSMAMAKYRREAKNIRSEMGGDLLSIFAWLGDSARGVLTLRKAKDKDADPSARFTARMAAPAIAQLAALRESGEDAKSPPETKMPAAWPAIERWLSSYSGEKYLPEIAPFWPDPPQAK